MYPHILLQWANLLGVVLLVGGVVFRWAVLNRSLEIFNQASPEQAAIRAVSGRDLKRLIGGCFILLVITSSIDLILRAQMMSGKPLSAMVSILPLVLLKTHLERSGSTKLRSCVYSAFCGFLSMKILHPECSSYYCWPLQGSVLH